MPKRNFKRSNQGRKAPLVTTTLQPLQGRRELAISAVAYMGPVRTPDVLRGQDCYTCVLTTDGALSTDAGGLIQYVFSSNPAVPGAVGAATGWSQFAAVFDEFRVLAFEVEFLSIYDQLISGASNMLSTVLDYDNATALTSYAVADNYGSQKNFSIQEYDGKVKKRKILMSGIENSVFSNTAAPAALFWIKFFASNLVVSTQVLHVVVRYRVQFRGKGV